MSEDLRILVDVRQEQGSVFVALDSGEVLELAPQSVPAELPDIGESLSSPLLAEIRLAAERKLAARALFAQLDRRLQPVARLRDKLRDKGFSPEAIAAVLDQMSEQGLYSDRHFAEAYCRDCLRGKAVGRRYLERKLREKRVPAELARSVPAEILSPEEEHELARQAARTRWRKERGSDRRKSRDKVTRFLLGRGFGTGSALQAARSEEPARSEKEEEF